MIHRPSRRPRGSSPRGARSAAGGSAARPPRQRRTTGALVGRTTKPTGRRTTAVTTRAAILALIVCSLVLALAYPIRAYVGQRGNIRALEQQRTQAQQRVDVLERQRAQWDDPAYVEAQARERLRYVKPGEKSLVVTDPVTPPSAAPAAATAPGAGTDDPWYERLWSTVEVAGTQPKPAKQPGKQPAKQPAGQPTKTDPTPAASTPAR